MCAAIVVALATMALAAEPQRSDSPDKPIEIKRTSVPIDRDKFGEGWKQTVRPKTFAGEGDVYEIAVEAGWLTVKRTTAAGQLEWQMFVAQVVDKELPVISTVDRMGNFELTYRHGRYFVRDIGNLLRAVRERPAAKQGWPRASLLGERAVSCGSGRSVLVDSMLSAWELDDWFVIAAGRNDQRFDTFVRLNPVKKRSPGYGVYTGPLFARYFHGDDTWIIDDGEMLVATRTTTAQYEAELAQSRVHQQITEGGPLPKLDITTWINTADKHNWESLRGKVVLVDFWGTWCGPCVKKLPAVQTFADKYGPRGVVVIGIHSAQDSETCREFVEKQGINFPIAIDSGKTAEGFAVESWPSVFLIDRAGKAVFAYENGLPSDETVEKLLK